MRLRLYRIDWGDRAWQFELGPVDMCFQWCPRVRRPIWRSYVGMRCFRVYLWRLRCFFAWYSPRRPDVDPAAWGGDS